MPAPAPRPRPPAAARDPAPRALRPAAAPRRLGRVADEGGTIPADELVRVMAAPRNDRAMALREAWSIILPHLVADDIAEALWA